MRIKAIKEGEIIATRTKETNWEYAFRFDHVVVWERKRDTLIKKVYHKKEKVVRIYARKFDKTALEFVDEKWLPFHLFEKELIESLKKFRKCNYSYHYYYHFEGVIKSETTLVFGIPPYPKKKKEDYEIEKGSYSRALIAQKNYLLNIKKFN